MQRKKELKKIEQEPYPETLDKTIELYYYTYGNGKGGFDNLSLEKFKDIIKTFVNDYGIQNYIWSEEDENNILFLTSIIEECFKDKEKITLYGDTVCANFTKDNVIDRLKSLKKKDRVQPK